MTDKRDGGYGKPESKNKRHVQQTTYTVGYPCSKEMENRRVKKGKRKNRESEICTAEEKWKTRDMRRRERGGRSMYKRIREQGVCTGECRTF